MLLWAAGGITEEPYTIASNSGTLSLTESLRPYLLTLVWALPRDMTSFRAAAENLESNETDEIRSIWRQKKEKKGLKSPLTKRFPQGRLRPSVMQSLFVSISTESLRDLVCCSVVR